MLPDVEVGQRLVRDVADRAFIGGDSLDDDRFDTIRLVFRSPPIVPVRDYVAGEVTVTVSNSVESVAGATAEVAVVSLVFPSADSVEVVSDEEFFAAAGSSPMRLRISCTISLYSSFGL
jgi:hypothetical protein